MKPSAPRRRSGFGLLGLIVLLAVAAILAGAVGPMLFREYLAARENETRDRLKTVEQGLLAFYHDTGRLPSEAEGLAALVTDPGVGGWHGPYVGAGRETAARTVGLDAWNRPLAYDRAPLLSAGSAGAIVVSGGGDGRLGSGTVGGTWTVGGTPEGTDGHDDLQILVDTAMAASGMEAVTRTRLEAVSAAAQEYFRVNARFPGALADLAGTWLPPTDGPAALLDGWGAPLTLTANAAAHPPSATVSSRGADGVAGNGDDLTLAISSAAAGRRSTSYELGIAQAALDAAPSQALTGNWPTDRAALGLDAFLDADGWGVPYAVRVATRTVLSAGPDGNYLTPADNLPAGVAP